MNKQDKACFDHYYKQLLKCLKLQGKSDNTNDSYSRGVRRLAEHFDCLPESLTPDDLKDYFAALVVNHSWSTVKVDHLGLQFYWHHILKKDWQWVDIVTNKTHGKYTLQSRPSAAGMLLPSVHGCILSAS